MAYILNIETATSVCSVSLADSGRLLHLEESDEPNLHSSQLTVYIEKLFKQTNLEMKQLNAVAVSKGPGSYTGLRIGVSVAKGICYALNIPLIAISTLQSMAYGYVQKYDPEEKDSWFCPMIDARRMEVYAAFYDLSNQLKKEISADIIDHQSYLEILNNRKVHFFGNGADSISISPIKLFEALPFFVYIVKQYIHFVGLRYRFLLLSV